MILCEALPSIISFLPTNVINLVINDNEFEILFITYRNCENYRNIDFSVINKDLYCVISLVKIFIFIEWLYSTHKVYVM